MNDSLYIAATGMHLQQKNVETISNNIANINTPGYKKGKVAFQDLVYRELNSSAQATAGQTQFGTGVGLAHIARTFEGGELKKSSNPNDLAIDGEGFIEVTGADGAPAYSRGGSLTVDRDGFLATAGGFALKPAIHVGSELRDLSITPDGRVLVRGRDQAQATEVGQLELVRFGDASGLAPAGAGIYRATERSGEPVRGRSGEDGMGGFAQGFIESSNVNLVEEMVDLMVAQRAYESSVKLIQAADEMLAMSNNLRK